MFLRLSQLRRSTLLSFGFLMKIAVSIVLFSLPVRANAKRHFIDQLGRDVVIADRVDRVVVLQHQTLDILVQLDAAAKIVGVLDQWQSLIPNLDRYAPGLKTLPLVGSLTSANIEEILKLKPDVVFVTNYIPRTVIRQLTQAGLPVVAISLAKGDENGNNQMNRTFADDDKAYSAGLREGITLIGEIVGKEGQAKTLVDYAFEKRMQVEKRVADITDDQRVRLYMANPDLHTYGSGKYVGVMMKRSGGYNVASAVRGATKVSMEQVVAWNPQVIFVQDRYSPVLNEIISRPQWQSVDAVKNKRVYLTPEYVKPWGFPLPEALALGELWMAKKLYPKRFADIDMNSEVQAYYSKFYRHSYDGVN